MAHYLLHDSFASTLTAEDDGKTSRVVPVHYLLTEYDTLQAAEKKATELCPPTLAGHNRRSLETKPVGYRTWEVQASYHTPDASEGGEQQDGGSSNAIANSISWDTTGSTEHITQAYNESETAWGGEYAYARPNEAANAPSYQGAINCTADAVQGIDVVVPAFNFTETWTLPAADVTDKYVTALYNLTGTINLKRFRIFDPGEVLFMGARCDRNRTDQLVKIAFQFSARPNRGTFKVGDVEVDYKNGWQYLWVKYEDHNSGSTLVKRPLFVIVNDVYPKGDFSALGIGTDTPVLSPPTVAAASTDFGKAQ